MTGLSPHPPHSEPGQIAYRGAGVDLDAAAAAIEAIRDLARAATSDAVVGGVGGFAGLFDLGDGRLLAAATDGVGTKLEVARLAGKLDTVGIDLVAMSANDVVCTGARPLFFLDYLAVGKLVPGQVKAIVGGVVEGCRRAECVLLGGETAEHPGTMASGEFDLAGFCVGVVDRRSVLDPGTVRPGDVLLGLPSTGLHSNGFSLVRKALVDAPGAMALDREIPSLGRTLGEELLEPTAIYVPAVLRLIRAGLVRSAAHITGGGFVENIPRALPVDLGALIDTSRWVRPPIFGMVAVAAGLEPEALYRVLNMGIGMVVVVPGGSEDAALEETAAAGWPGLVIGGVTDQAGIRLV